MKEMYRMDRMCRMDRMYGMDWIKHEDQVVAYLQVTFFLDFFLQILKAWKNYLKLVPESDTMIKMRKKKGHSYSGNFIHESWRGNDLSCRTEVEREKWEVEENEK